MSTRIYHARNTKTGAQHLVRASSATQAVRFVAERGWIAEVATPDALVELTIKGEKVQDAGENGNG